MTKNRQKSPLQLALDKLGTLIERLKHEHDTGTAPGIQFEKLFESRTYLFSRENVTLILSDEDAEELSDCFLDLYKVVAGKGDQLSRRAIESAAQQAILDALDVAKGSAQPDFSKRLADSLSKLRKELQQNPIEWRIHLEVAGLTHDSLPAIFGDTQFYLLDASRAADFEKHFVTVIESSRNTDDQKQQVKQLASRALSERMQGRTYAAVRVFAVDKTAAEALAIKRMGQTLDVLNFFAPNLAGTGTQVYLPWDAKPHQLYSIAQSAGTERFALPDMSWHGPANPLSFALINKPGVQSWGLKRASDILARRNPGRLEDRLLSALQWAGRATVEDNIEESFLLFAVSLESLLLDKNDREEVTQRFAIRGAHVLGRDTKSRKQIYRELKRFYGLRSRVVHSGSTEVTDIERDTIRHFASAAIVTMLVAEPFAEMSTSEDFERWIEDQILGPESGRPVNPRN